MADSVRMDVRSAKPEARRETHGEIRRDALRAREGRPVVRQVLGPDGVVRTRLAREAVLGDLGLRSNGWGAK